MDIPRRDYYRIIYRIARHTDLLKSNYQKRNTSEWMYYKDIRKQLKVPYVIYADFESLLVPIKGCENDPEKSQTAKTTKHIACGFAGKVVGLTKGTSKQPIVYRGQYTVVKFVECIVQKQEDIEQKFKHCETMLMTEVTGSHSKKQSTVISAKRN
jgi:hypothetical protein